jgi:hypothetical protein
MFHVGDLIENDSTVYEIWGGYPGDGQTMTVYVPSVDQWLEVDDEGDWLTIHVVYSVRPL